MSNNGKRELTLEEELKVEYCIPTFLRDEQIKQNCKKVSGRVVASCDVENGLRDDPIALVNFGPSLNDTWEKIKDFKYTMSCSGAHKFLVEHGIIPTYHIDVDPREHKIGLMGQPQKETEYLIASTCHPKLIDHLKGYNLKLWHIFDTSEDGFRLLPPSEWAITGGCSVGVRTITLARFLGFRDLHIFGMDGCLRDSATHASFHPNGTKKPYTLVYDGKEYKTTPPMLAAVKNTWHELDMMKDVKTTFYGEGLVQEMAKKYERKPEENCFIAFVKPELISSDYRKLNEQLHEDNLLYGIGGSRHADTVVKLVNQLAKKRISDTITPKTQEGEPKLEATSQVSVLDYGCGKGHLAKSLPFPIYEYDPAVPGKTEPPKPADLVVCTDVLEHIEPEKLDCVLDDIRRCAKEVAFMTIHTGKSSKNLADGRNSHLIIEGVNFWREKLEKYFLIPRGGITVKGVMIIALAVARNNSRFVKMNKLKAA